MKKTKIAKLLIISMLFILLVGCVNFYNIKTRFIDAGYTYDKDVEKYASELMEEIKDNKLIVKPHLFYKGINLAIILEFKSSKELLTEIDKSETIKGLIKDIRKSEIVRSNFLLIPIGIDRTEMINIFQS